MLAIIGTLCCIEDKAFCIKKWPAKSCSLFFQTSSIVDNLLGSKYSPEYYSAVFIGKAEKTIKLLQSWINIE